MLDTHHRSSDLSNDPDVQKAPSEEGAFCQ